MISLQKKLNLTVQCLIYFIFLFSRVESCPLKMILTRLINTKRKYVEQNPLVDNFSGWRTLELWINLSFQIIDVIGPLNKRRLL